MKSSLFRVLIAGTIVAFLISFSIMAPAAEKKVFSINVKNEKFVSEKVLQAYGSERVQIRQGENLNVITDSKDAELIGAEQTVHWQRDLVIGHTGTARGYTIIRPKDGGVIYSRYDTTFKIVQKEWPKTEVHFSAKHQIIGGDGKYYNATGSFSCQGIETKTEQTSKCEGEWKY